MGRSKKPKGRPEIEINPEQVQKLAMLHCSGREIAAFFGCDEKTIRNRFTAEIEKGREKGKMTLRQKQYELAINGNVPLLIWLGKNMLDQKDKNDVEIEHSGGLTINLVKYTEKLTKTTNQTK